MEAAPKLHLEEQIKISQVKRKEQGISNLGKGQEGRRYATWPMCGPTLFLN